MISKQEYEQALSAKAFAERYGQQVQEYVLKAIAEYEQQLKQGKTTPIYTTLLVESKHKVTPEQCACVEETVDELLSDDENAEDPGLLLGKIQCGKTETFERIIALAFDKGFDIAIVLTKGTKALVNQTIIRLQDDFHTFKEGNPTGAQTIVIEDIMDNRGGFNKGRLSRSKLIIVAKKETKNLDYLIKIFSGSDNEWMRRKKVLIVDDEADFASRNYRSLPKKEVKDADGNLVRQPNKIGLAVVSKKIDILRTMPQYCRYLQVTATPYCLFLQPDGKTLNLEDGDALPFRPRFTKVVPIHPYYVGGYEYFELGHKDESPFSHLYHPVVQKNLDVLAHEDKRYLKSGIASGNLIGLTYSLIAYFMATAIRRIQERTNPKPHGEYMSSAIYHVATDTDKHAWEQRLMEYMVKQIKNYFLSADTDDKRLEFFINEIYKDFEISSEKARNIGKQDRDGNTIYDSFGKPLKVTAAFPALDEVIKEVALMFKDDEVSIKVVNTDNDVPSMLDRETGQLRLDPGANIFIGGSILDRGITVNNLLCFFYGRDSRQQDTVLQHARFYGSRSIEDIAVTRLYTSEEIYHILMRMNALDDLLREWLVKGFSNPDPSMVFVGYDKYIQPCAPSKVKPTETLAITGGTLFAPKGMLTDTKDKINKTIAKIDKLITSAPEYANQDEDGFFHMDMARAMEILHLIESTYRYNDENADRKGDMHEIEAALHYCARMAGGKVLVIHRTNRNMSRIRENGAWIDMPADGRTDLAPAHDRSYNVPVVMLLRQNGEKKMEQIGVNPDGSPIMQNKGWSGTPFYWPVLLTQNDIESVLFAADVKDQGKTAVYSIDEILGDIDREDVLILPYKYDLQEQFGPEGSVYEDLEDAPVETRAVRDTTAGKYFLRDLQGVFAISPDVTVDNKVWADVYSYNHGDFPFILKQYKYLLLTQGRGARAQVMLLELFPQSDWNVFPSQTIDMTGYLLDYIDDNVRLAAATDTIINPDRTETTDTGSNLCQWIIEFPVRKVLKYINHQVADNTSVG